jgi:hypothetical protein
MDYQFIADSNLVGQEFYNPQEYNERGIIYTIIDMDDSGLDLEWEEGVEYASMTLRELINGLNDNFYVLKSDDPNMSFLDQIW